jgi:hypothetical protein
MGDRKIRFSRRHFLSGLAPIGTAPVRARLDTIAAPPPARTFTGDDSELADRLLFKPDDVLSGKTPEPHADMHDVLVTDTQGAPAYEKTIAAAFDAVDAVEKFLTR